MTPLQKGCFATEFFEFFSRVFSVNSPGTARHIVPMLFREGKCVAELVFAVESHISG
jgi:hypothetical protein